MLHNRKFVFVDNARNLGNRLENMALEEKERIAIIDTILEAEEEVTITPPARRKKAERLKNKSNGTLPLPASEDESNDLNGKDVKLNKGSVLVAVILEKNGQPEPTKHGLSLQGDTINSAESRESANGMSNISISAEVKDNDCSFGNIVENSSVEAKQLPGLANEANSEFISKEKEEVATTLSVFSDIKEEPKVGVPSCISPDITIGTSQDEESFYSAEEAETASEHNLPSLPNVAEVVNETATGSENNEDLSTIKSENTNKNTTQESVSNLAQDDQEFSGAQVSDSSESVNEPLPTQAEDLDKSCENNHSVPENSDKGTETTETTVINSNITNSSDNNTSVTVKIDSTVSDLSAETEVGAVGGVLETDTDTDEEWSSSSNTSSEGEYDVGYFELNCGLKVQDFEADSKDGLNEILSAFPSGTELVSVTTDSEDDSNKGDTPRNSFKSTEQLKASLFDDDESDAGLKMLACFSPRSECPVVMDNTITEQEKSVVTSATDLCVDGDHVDNNNTKSLTKAASSAGEVVLKDPDCSDNDTVVQLDVGDTAMGQSLESTSPENPPLDEGNFIVKRTGSFRLVKNNGLLKIVDTSETPVTSEDIKKANILKTRSLKAAESGSDDKPGCVGEGAREVLQNAVSESKALEEEFKNVCDNIAALENMSTDSSEVKTNRGDLGEDSVDSGGVVIAVESMAAVPEQKPTLKLTDATTIDSVTDDAEVSTGENGGEESGDNVDNASSDSTKKQRPKRLPLGKRYSFDTGTALLSPEDIGPELTKFANTGSFKVQAPVSTEGQTTDGGQKEDAAASPAPPPRGNGGRGPRLNYSGSFSPGASTPVMFRTKEGNRPITKRARSERRSKTLPNNVFDMFGSAFKTSTSSTDQMLHGPITLITDNMPAAFPGFPINRRAQVALELYTTERSYVRRLETVLQLFKKPCEENKLLDKKEIHTMFLNIQDIYVVNKDLLFLLQERISHWHDHQCIGDIFIDQSSKIIDRMKIYAKYCNNYDSAEKLYKEKIRKREFETFVNSCYEHRVCQAGLNLPAYLISVVQRIPRYLLLLEDLMKRTPENHPDHTNLSKALMKMEHLAVYINNQLQTAVGIKAMEQLRLRVEGLKALEGRALIKEAEVVVNGSKKTRQALLLNDMLVFAAKGVARTSEVEKTLELGTLWCMDLEGNNPQSVKEDSLEIYTPEHSYIMYAGTKNEKKVWLQKLRTAVAMALHGEEANENYEIESRKATFTYKDGRNYCGNFVSGKRHGQGTLSWPNQAKYQGQWEDDDRCGWGELLYNSGDKYRGEWLDDKQHGTGTMEYMNGDVYHGQWYQGDMHGKGAIDFKNGDRFEGEFYDNEIQGPSGELRCVSGLMYRGEWQHSKKHGKGRMHFPNGDIYNGGFANDRLSGYGEMQYADGSVYKGQWMDNQRGGHGEFSSPDGTHYVGGWSKDHINGKGCMKYSNGDNYDGNWFKNNRFGQGVMKYRNGDVYEGIFEYDLYSKVGKMMYKDGSVYEGSWSNGLRHGKGKMVYANKKSVYEGDWIYGMRHGEGVLTYANRASYNGHWELDKQHGRGMYTDSSTFYHYEGEWKNGLKHGKGVEETKEGKYEGEWKDNMRHGQGTEILSCETVYEGRWKENRKHGPGIKRLKSGMKEAQNWLEGKQIDITSIDVIELPLIQRR